MPTSVTTAVICVGGVRSYNGLRISRLVEGARERESCGQTMGNGGKISPRGATQMEFREFSTTETRSTYLIHSS